MTKEVKKEEVKLEEKAVDNTIVETKKLTKEEYKERFRNQSIEYRGRLYIDDKYKVPGKRLRIDNGDAATRKYLEQLGYTVVKRNIEVGSGSLSEASSLGSEVSIEQGITFSQPGILYEIDEDLYQARKEIEVEDNNKLFDEKVSDSQREDQKK